MFSRKGRPPVRKADWTLSSDGATAFEDVLMNITTAWLMHRSRAAGPVFASEHDGEDAGGDRRVGSSRRQSYSPDRRSRSSRRIVPAVSWPAFGQRRSS